jgi:homocysteine S-methyltransferase
MSLRDIIDQKKFCMLDGGFGSTISSQVGVTLDPLLFASGALREHPQAVVETHRCFLNSGADILTTASYQVSYPGFRQRYSEFIEADVFPTIQSSIDLANQAKRIHVTSSSALIAASIGCYGAHLANGSEYFGNYGRNIEELMNWHRPALHYLLQSNANIIAMETIPSLDEVKAIVQLLNEDELHQLPRPSITSLWISLACKSSSKMNGGEDIEDAIRYIEDQLDSPSQLKVDLSVNCTPPEHVEDILHLLSSTAHADRLKIVYPNKGEVWDMEKNCWIANQNDDELMGNYAVQWYDAGARVIGGCCRCSPQTISCMRHRLLCHLSSSTS